jgi:hypothetical protein
MENTWRKLMNKPVLPMFFKKYDGISPTAEEVLKLYKYINRECYGIDVDKVDSDAKTKKKKE